MSLSLAGIDTPELRDSFELCRRTHQTAHAPIYLLVELLPMQIRPYLHALYAFVATTDHIADEGDPADRRRALADWCADTREDLRTMRSTHPLRRAMVHTVRMWNLDVDVVEELLVAFEKDSHGPAEFATFTELRGFLRGIGGTVAELAVPMLEPITADSKVRRLMSLLGETFQLVDNFQDFAIDLPRAKCYLPLQDLDQLGLTRADLTSGKRGPSLDMLVERQVRRARALLDEGARVTSLLHPASQPFLQAAVAGMSVYLDEVHRRQSSALWEEVRLGLPKSLLTSGLFVPNGQSVRPRLPRMRVPNFVARRMPRFRPARSPREVPRHIAVIMDGNRRWAEARGLSALQGHAAGQNALGKLIRALVEMEVPNLTVFAFSAHNWSRGDAEVSGLMDLLAQGVHQRLGDLHDWGVRVRWCGRRDRVHPDVRAELVAAEELTQGNRRLTFTLCVDYGGRSEILDATKRLAAEASAGRLDPARVTEDDFVRYLYEPDLADVDLLIRTSGERRISDFMPWQAAHAEIVFDDVCWPDFDRRRLRRAIAEYSTRDRRFGGNAPLHVAVK